MNDDRTPPQDNDAEQSVLGAMILSKAAIGDVAETELRGADFYRPQHETIYDTILGMYGRGDPVDTVTVINELTELGELERVGGAPYVFTLTERVPTAANAGHYAGIVREKKTFRNLIDAGTRIVQMGYAQQGDATDIADASVAEVMAAVPSDRATDYVTAGESIESTLDLIDASAAGERLGVPTGFLDLDDLLGGGLLPGQMVIVAGRPGMGKSTLGLDICRAVSIKTNLTSVMFSLEMSRQELTMRTIAAQAQVQLNHLKDGALLSRDEWDRIAAAVPVIGKAPLFFDDSPGLNMTEIRAKARRLKQDHDLRLIVIDYLQLMTSGVKAENRQVEVSEFSRQAKLLAKELDVPVVVLSQLNRGPENRHDKRPLLSDLRESGSLEQDADIVILLHRPDMYERESDRPGEADLIVAKHRNGPTRDLTVAAQMHYSRFVDMAPGY